MLYFLILLKDYEYIVLWNIHVLFYLFYKNKMYYLLLCIPLVCYIINRKINKIVNEIHETKKEYYFSLRKLDNNASINRINYDKKLEEIRIDFIELNEKFDKLNNFYNKRMNVVYKEIYNLKSITKDIQG